MSEAVLDPIPSRPSSSCWLTEALWLGGKQFSRSLQPVDKDGNAISIWSKDSHAQSDEDDGDSSSEDEEDSEPNNAVGSAKPAPAGNDRDARKAQKKARQQAALAKQNGHTVEPGDLPSSDESDDGADMPANPNHSRAAHSMTQKAADGSDDGEGANGPPSRREREALEAVAAKERYLKLQAQGKTDEAKADMARLKLIREQREAEAARRQVRSPRNLEPPDQALGC